MNERMNMRLILLTTALALLLTASGDAAAQETRYRVEVIVLTHLGHVETPREVATLRDYGDALDFLAPTEDPDSDGDEAGAAPPEVARDDIAPATDVVADETDGTESEAEIPAVVPIEELGAEMQDAWRRLRLSGPFRPLVSLAWEQADTPPFPLLRVHDANVVMTQDPWAAIRTRLEAGEPVDAWLEAGLAPPIPPRPVNEDEALPADKLERDPEAELLESLPPPRRFYALDGTVSLVRSRFLHLYVDLQQREGVYEAMPTQPILLPRGLRTQPAAPPESALESTEIEPVPTAFRVFELEQNRQVKTGQVEYFDGPVLSVLAYITAIEPERGESGSP